MTEQEQEVLATLATELEAEPAPQASAPTAAEYPPKRRKAASISASPEAALYAAISRAQGEMPAVEKDATNPHFKSKFVSIDHLIALTRPVLNRHGLAILQLPIRGDDGQPLLRTMIVHEEGGSISADMPLLPGKQDMQGLGAAITYARRFAWASACGIASESDDDGESIATHNTAPKATGASQTASGAQTDGGRTPLHEKDFKAVQAIRRKLIENGLTEEQFKTSLVSNYGTEHVSELTQEQTRDLAARLREAEKQLPVTS